MKNTIILLSIILSTLSLNIHAQSTNSVSIDVSGACGMCKERIENAALEVNGVKKANWDSEKQELSVTVQSNEFKLIKLHRAIAKVGHDTKLIKAEDDVYNQLPGCCQYRSPDNPHLQDDDENHEGHNHELETANEHDGHNQEQDNDTYDGNKADVISGTVFERTEHGKLIPLLFANLVWEGTTDGTSSDVNGNFTLVRNPNNHNLIISYVGYKTDTIHIEHAHNAVVEIELSNSVDLDAVVIRYIKRTTEISRINPLKIQNISEGELQKAACCNLSESFQTNPSIDVGFTDAVTGAKKIEMLGLAGKYVQITRESMPDIRGLSSINGLSYTPGHWIQGIQLNMGTGSVANGFESITGQINVELRKPEDSDPFFLNLYGNNAGRIEANLNVSHVINDKLSTGLLLHGNVKNNKSDHNGDGFLDKPMGNQIILLNRWKVKAIKGFEGQFGVKAMMSDKTSGQVDFDNYTSANTPWVAKLNTNRVEAWLKSGRVLPNSPYSSFGFQFSGVLHDQKNKYGNTLYDATQKSLYGNFLYQSIINNTNHKYRTGISYQLDNIEETIDTLNYNRSEHVPGTFFEYTYLPNEKFTLVAGIRGDWHSDYGFFYTPRLNLKYALSEKTIFRAAGGRGQRTSNIFAENIGYFASSRQISIRGNNADTPYGLLAEVAWNIGLNLVKEFDILGQPLVFSLDGYHTTFENQIVIDVENPREVVFYNLNGKSFSNSIQSQIDYGPTDNFDIRIAYRFNDVKTDYDSGLLTKPLSSKHRAFINLAYETGKTWKFDVTANWQGEKRIPSTASNPLQYQTNTHSPSFFMFNAQISKEWKEVFELYVGINNILDYRQNDPIISADNPFNDYFDSSLIWGPVFGREIYFGLRYKLRK